MSDTTTDWSSPPDPEPSSDSGAQPYDQTGTDTSWSQADPAGSDENATADATPAPEAATDPLPQPPEEVATTGGSNPPDGLPPEALVNPEIPPPPGLPTGDMGPYDPMVKELAAEAGAGAEGGAALGVEAAAPVVAAGAVGVGAGYVLATDTRVGQTTTNTVGAIDQALSTPGQESWLLSKDEERQQAWDQSEYGTATVDAVEEGGVGLAGAVGGLAAGAASAAQDYAGAAWDVVTDTDPDS